MQLSLRVPIPKCLKYLDHSDVAGDTNPKHL